MKPEIDFYLEIDFKIGAFGSRLNIVTASLEQLFRKVLFINFPFTLQQDPYVEDPDSDIEIDLSNDNDSEAGSDYSETSSDSDCQVTASEIKPPYKTREDFMADEEYEEYVLENVKVGASVRFKDSKESRSEVGTVLKVSFINRISNIS